MFNMKKKAILWMLVFFCLVSFISAYDYRNQNVFFVEVNNVTSLVEDKSGNYSITNNGVAVSGNDMVFVEASSDFINLNAAIDRQQFTQVCWIKQTADDDMLID